MIYANEAKELKWKWKSVNFRPQLFLRLLEHAAVFEILPVVKQYMKEENIRTPSHRGNDESIALSSSSYSWLSLTS